jgi:hypothetical protein
MGSPPVLVFVLHSKIPNELLVKQKYSDSKKKQIPIQPFLSSTVTNKNESIRRKFCYFWQKGG